MATEMAHNLAPWSRGEPSEALRKLLAHGRSVSPVDYLGALAKAQRYAASLTDIFDAYDAIVTLAAPGVAPKWLGSTGDPAFCSRPCRCRCSRARVPFRSGCNSSARPATTAASCARRAR
jgi:Asp-tRNA(Asn)/Glu-tRNA(Gln) amidotransferase A subunit family amidase